MRVEAPLVSWDPITVYRRLRVRSPTEFPGCLAPTLRLMRTCRVLSGADYNLVLGMPGAGKTSTIVAAVAALAAAGRSVLVTSYTNRCARA